MRGRIARTLALVALVTLALAGCGVSGQSGQGTAPTVTTAPKTLAQVGGVRVIVSVNAS